MKVTATLLILYIRTAFLTIFAMICECFCVNNIIMQFVKGIRCAVLGYEIICQK